MAEKEKEQSIGALWVKEGRSGEFMSGTVEIGGEKHAIICFLNGHKKGNQPDWRIFRQRPRSAVPNPDVGGDDIPM